MERSEQIDALAKALAAFNAEIEDPPANKSKTIRHKDGGSHVITYADLAGITATTRAPLARNGLSIVGETSEQNGMVGVELTLMHETGQWMTFAPVWIPAGNEAKDTGGAVTYSRRYGLATVLNIAPEKDDDAPNTSRPAAPRPEITADEFSAVRTKWRAKGKTDEWIARLLVQGGYTGPLEMMPRKAFEFLARDLDKLPDVADPVTGELTGQPADAEATDLAAQTFDGDDGDVPGVVS